MGFKNALLYALLAMALVIIFFAVTECCFETYDPWSLKKDIDTDAGFPDDFEIDDTVWERELPPYFDDTNKEGR